MLLARAHRAPPPPSASAAPPSLSAVLAMMEQVLAQAGVALAVVDATGRLLHGAMPDARLQSMGLSLWGGRVSGQGARETRALRAAIADATGRDPASSFVTMGDGACHIRLWVAPAPPAAGEAPLAMLIGCAAQPVPAADCLQRAFDLTPAEARLLRALALGQRVENYARQTGVAMTTVKAHLRQLFAKTGAQRQADLVRLVLGDPALRLAAFATP